jgi:hypothetical protein
MQATVKGIDIGGRVIDALLAFAGDNEEQARVFFKVKGSRVLAAATAKDRSLEVEGEAQGAEAGEWPVEARFLRNVGAMTINGSKKVPAVVARLLCERTGVSTADLVVLSSGERVDTVKHHAEMPQNRQLSFAQIKKTIAIDLEKKGAWFPLDRRFFAPLGLVSMAAEKCPISFHPAKDEAGPIFFQATGGGLVFRGILVPPAVQGPGEQAVEPEDSDDADDEKQGDLFGEREDDESYYEEDDDGIITDEKAAALKAKHRGAKEPALATEKKRGRRKANRASATN